MITTSNPQGSTSGSTTVGSVTLSYTATSMTTMLIVALGTRNATDLTNLSIKYNNVNLTSFASVRGATNGNRLDYWYLLNPPTGAAHDIVAAWTNNSVAVLQAACLLGTSGPPNGAVTDTGNSTGATQAVVTAVGDIAIGAAQFTAAGTLSGDTTLNSQLDTSGANTFIMRTSYAMATTTSTTLTFTSTASARFGYVAFSVTKASDDNFFLMF